MKIQVKSSEMRLSAIRGMTRRNALALSMVAMLALSACGGSSNSQPDYKPQAIALLKSLETGDISVASATISPLQYIQHDLDAPDGLDGFIGTVQSLPKGATTVNTVRAFQDGNYVFTHTDYNFYGPKVGFDVLRFDGGKVVEHWDNLQTKPATNNPSGRSMLDGTTTIKDLDKTEANKAVVQSFADEILLAGKFEKLNGYFNGNDYLQHDPLVGDTVSGFVAWLGGVSMKYEKVFKVLGEGNFVLMMSQGQFQGNSVGFYDLFRIESGKIAEHWDVIQTIPPVAQWKNSNGKY